MKDERIAFGPERSASVKVKPCCPFESGTTALPGMMNVVLNTLLGGREIRGCTVIAFACRDMEREYDVASSRKKRVREKEEAGLRGKTENVRGAP